LNFGERICQDDNIFGRLLDKAHFKEFLLCVTLSEMSVYTYIALKPENRPLILVSFSASSSLPPPPSPSYSSFSYSSFSFFFFFLDWT
jgi:hypothetical protein